MSSNPERPGVLRRLSRHRIAKIFTKFTAGSVLAMLASEATLLTMLGLSISGPKTASVAAWFAGAVVNYFVSRTWAWGRRGRANAWREVLPFWATSVAQLLISTVTSDLAHGVAPDVTSSHTLQVSLVGAVYLGTYGVLFIGKFLLFHFVIFGRAPAAGTASR